MAGMTEAARQPGRRLLPRGERRAQLINAAAVAFARAGFAATGLDDIAHEAGVTRAIIYRHFGSKTELYEAVLDDIQTRLRDRLGEPDRYHDQTARDLVTAACADPNGFRLLFGHASREPEVAGYLAQRNRVAMQTAERYLRSALPDDGHRRWIAGLIPKLTIELILSWLDAGRPTTEDELVRTITATSRALSGRSAG